MANIGIDFFGTLGKSPAFWQEMLGYAIEEGHKIHVISGPWPDALKTYLRRLGFVRNTHYSQLHSILSFLTSIGYDTFFDENHDSWYSDENAWWDVKARICKEQAIALHIDSDVRFGKAFETVATRFILSTSKTGHAQILEWYQKLHLANTYEDWDETYMQGFVPC